MSKGETLAAAGCAAFFAFMLWQAVELQGTGRSGEIGSGFWPMLSLGACTLLSLAWLVSGLARGRPAAAAPPPGETAAEAWSRRCKVGFSVAALFLYIVALPWVGFVLATLAFVLIFALGLGERRRVVLTVSPFLVTIIVVLVFARFITIPLPRGAGVFATFSRLLY
jgi:hypothetical protein